MIRNRRFDAPVHAFAATLCVLAAHPAAAAQVTTIAGDGTPGVRDGAAAAAQFVRPMGVAYDGAGNLYIADAGAQRIRVLSRAGTVRTIAGGGPLESGGLLVTPGNAVGPALQARFNTPQGIAADASGRVFIADTNNHCIRLLANGQVTTYVGNPDAAPGSFDGANASATFTTPRGLALDLEGNLYVADQGVGVRVVTSAGAVTTLPGLPRELSGVSIAETASAKTLFVAARDGVYVVDLRTGNRTHFVATGGLADLGGPDRTGSIVAGSRAFGFPFGIAGIDRETFVYTDPWFQNVRLSEFGNTTESLGGAPDLDANVDGGGFSDGSTSAARFDGPAGIAVLGRTRAAIADSANRRIRMVTFTLAENTLDPAVLKPDAKSFQIVVVGNSVVRYGLNDDQSLGSALQRRLSTNTASYGFPRPPRVSTVLLLAGVSEQTQFIKQILAGGVADLVVWVIDSGSVASDFGPQLPLALPMANYPLQAPLATYPQGWQAKTTDAIKDAAAALKSAGIPLVVAVAPIGPQVAPGESLWYTEYAYPYSPTFEEFRGISDQLDGAVQASGAPLLDLFPAFLRAEREPDHAALFMSRDFHNSPAGADLMARSLAAYLRTHRVSR